MSVCRLLQRLGKARLSASSPPCPAAAPADLHSSYCRLAGALGLRGATQSSRLGCSAAPPGITGLSQALGHGRSFCRVTELRPCLLCPLARGRRRGCWNTVERHRDRQPRQEAVSSPGTPSSRGLGHPLQWDTHQWVAGAKSAFAKGNVTNKSRWCLRPAAVTMRLATLPFSVPEGTGGALHFLASRDSCTAMTAHHVTRRAASLPNTK